MCESDLVVRKDGKEEVVMRDVAFMFFKGDVVVLKDIMGNEKRLDLDKIEMIDLVKHKIYVKERGKRVEKKNPLPLT